MHEHVCKEAAKPLGAKSFIASDARAQMKQNSVYKAPEPMNSTYKAVNQETGSIASAVSWSVSLTDTSID